MTSPEVQQAIAKLERFVACWAPPNQYGSEVLAAVDTVAAALAAERPEGRQPELPPFPDGDPSTFGEATWQGQRWEVYDRLTDCAHGGPTLWLRPLRPEPQAPVDQPRRMKANAKAVPGHRCTVEGHERLLSCDVHPVCEPMDPPRAPDARRDLPGVQGLLRKLGHDA